MTYQQVIFANDEFYHVFNRGVEKRQVFEAKRDFRRFIETFIYYQQTNPPTRFSFRKEPLITDNSQGGKLVEIICYALMPTHFHLLLKQSTEEGITTFMSKISNSYTKFFNTKHRRCGPLFEGSFKAIRIEDDEQLLHVSRYIHLNPLIDYLTHNLRLYPYSSYPEYTGISNTSNVCAKEPILSHFKSFSDYEKFVQDQEDYGRKIKMIERLLLEQQEEF